MLFFKLNEQIFFFRHLKTINSEQFLPHLPYHMRADCEVYGLFRDLIPVEALGEEEDLQRGRGRQGLLPDFRLEIPSPAGEPEYRLAELKMIGAVPKWYPRSGNLARSKRGGWREE